MENTESRFLYKAKRTDNNDMKFKTKFKYKNNLAWHKSPFNGKYITALTRIPNIGEHICFDGANYYKVVDVITELKGWECFYTIVLE